MRPWMLTLPPLEWNQEREAACQSAFLARDAALLPEWMPRLVFLEWLTRRGWLLHGSNLADLTVFEPRTPTDLSPDDTASVHFRNTRKGTGCSSNSQKPYFFLLPLVGLNP